MGSAASTDGTRSSTTTANASSDTAYGDTSTAAHPSNNGKSEQIAALLASAQSSFYQDNNPTQALTALLHAMELNSGPASAERTRERLQRELGLSDLSPQEQHERAVHMVQTLLQDESTLLFQQGRQDLLRQTMQDGSSVVCVHCQAVVASTRWEQHQLYWCSAKATAALDSDNEEAEEDDVVMKEGD